jgi:DNA-binding NarL/FixJ family response regulator
MSYWPLILIVDDSATDVQIISEMLNSEYRVKVCHNGVDALEAVQRSPTPDLILLDIIMPRLDGFAVFQQLKQSPSTRDIPVIFLTALTDESHETRALNLLAADYITKPYSIPVARARIRNKLLSRAGPETRLNGDAAPSGTMPLMEMAEAEPASPLSKRETEVLELVAQGLTSAEISARLSIAKGTVEVHRENIMRKLEVRNIAGLVRWAIRLGLLAP